MSLLVVRKCKRALDIIPQTETEIEESDLALALIRLNCNERWQTKISSFRTANSAWNYIADEHLSALIPNASALQKKFFSNRMTDTQSVDNFIDSVESIERDLIRVGQPIAANVISSHILSNLKPSLANISKHLITSRTPISLSELRYDLRALASTQAPEEHMANAAVPERRAAPFAQRARRPGISADIDACHHCGKPGHTKFFCRAWRLLNPPAPDADAPLRAMAAGLTAGLDTRSVSGAPGSWLVDSGSTAHMVVSEDDFEFIEYFPKGRHIPVELADGSHVFATGWGEVLLPGILCPIPIVAYLVPDLRHNLLSMSDIISDGHTSVFSANALTIYRACDELPQLTATQVGGAYLLDQLSSDPVPPRHACRPSAAGPSSDAPHYVSATALRGTVSVAPDAPDSPSSDIALPPPPLAEISIPSLPLSCDVTSSAGTVSTPRSPRYRDYGCPGEPFFGLSRALAPAIRCCSIAHCVPPLATPSLAPRSRLVQLRPALVNPSDHPTLRTTFALQTLFTMVTLQSTLWGLLEYGLHTHVPHSSDMLDLLSPRHAHPFTPDHADDVYSILSRSSATDWLPAVRHVLALNDFSYDVDRHLVFSKPRPTGDDAFLVFSPANTTQPDHAGTWHYIDLGDLVTRATAAAADFLYSRVDHLPGHPSPVKRACHGTPTHPASPGSLAAGGTSTSSPSFSGPGPPRM